MNISAPLPRHCGRTILRSFSEADLERFQAYRTDPEVARYQDWEQMTDNEALAFFRATNATEFLLPGCWTQIAIAEASSGQLIGDVGILIAADEKEAEIGFTLHRAYQKQGLGREAVGEAIQLIYEQTRVARIIGVTDDRNLASVRLLEFLGMDRVDSKQAVFRGEHCVELSYALYRGSGATDTPNR
ncbi:GNAT family N-acetyltransferase [Granulosicoccus sp. 3-233]|uniref:GNAT family N-acetyltransferase n=1 Tax=Granulosicoccus sp. 3-233 TaxID=3417969 RepID=UPI003D32949E